MRYDQEAIGVVALTLLNMIGGRVTIGSPNMWTLNMTIGMFMRVTQPYLDGQGQCT